jgi:hypothetical protein
MNLHVCLVLLFEQQVENEYGSYGLQTGHCDKRYLARMRDLLRQLVGPKPVLFTTDGDSEDLGTRGQISYQKYTRMCTLHNELALLLLGQIQIPCLQSVIL